MYKNLIKISTVGMSREEWLEERRKSLGGSDVSAVLGMNEYCSAFELYAEKKKLLPEKEDSEAMRIGRDLEDYVAKRFVEKTGKKVRRENAIIRNPDMPYLHANVDRVIVGENAVLECKTVSALNLKKYRNGEYPERFYAQCCEYMLVCGFDKAYLAVLVLGKGFYVFEVERDEEELKALNTACKEFWAHVESNTPPAVDGSKSSEDTLSAIYPESNGETVDISAFNTVLAERSQLDAQIKALTDLKKECENKVKAFMQNAAKGESDRFKVSYPSSVRRTFDVKSLAADHPEINTDKYYTETISRTFRVTEKGA